jgi:hypothetical protein
MTAAIRSTRSNKNPDARQDFDGFDVDEELRRFRAAARGGQLQVAVELAANIDEHLSRGGDLPVAWLGPACLQEDADHAERYQEAIQRAARMSAAEREEAIWGYHIGYLG